MKRAHFGVRLVAAGVVLVGSTIAIGQEPKRAAAARRLTEAELIERIERGAEAKDNVSAEARLMLHGMRIHSVNALLEAYPKSEYRARALAAKLEALASLARLQPQYLEQLLKLTEEISAGDPKEPLASENAFYAIQAFVAAARLEKMPQDRRNYGSIERYNAFLADHPSSEHRPIIWASLIRSLIEVGNTERAAAELVRFTAEYPEHPAMTRARGEVNRVRSVGKPFKTQLDAFSGAKIDTGDYLGKVVVIYFRLDRGDAAVEDLAVLRALHEKYAKRGLRLVGVHVVADKSLLNQSFPATDDLPWPHHRAEKGLQSEVLIRFGVSRFPAYYVVDRRGVLRTTDPGEGLSDLIEKLLAEPAADAG